MNKVLICLVLLLPIHATADHDFRRTGNFLLQACQAEQTAAAKGGIDPNDTVTLIQGITCGSFILGIYGLLHNEGQICVPKGVLFQQIVSVVVDWLQRNSRLLHEHKASRFVEAALLEAFPCE